MAEKRINLVLSKFEQSVLSCLAFDYENANSIKGNVSEDMGVTVSQMQINDAFLSLAKKGLAAPYRYDQANDIWVKGKPNGIALDFDSWWLITPAGRSVLER